MPLSQDQFRVQISYLNGRFLWILLNWNVTICLDLPCIQSVCSKRYFIWQKYTNNIYQYIFSGAWMTFNVISFVFKWTSVTSPQSSTFICEKLGVEIDRRHKLDSYRVVFPWNDLSWYLNSVWKIVLALLGLWKCLGELVQLLDRRSSFERWTSNSISSSSNPFIAWGFWKDIQKGCREVCNTFTYVSY